MHIQEKIPTGFSAFCLITAVFFKYISFFTKNCFSAFTICLYTKCFGSGFAAIGMPLGSRSTWYSADPDSDTAS